MSVIYSHLGNMGRIGNSMFQIACTVGYGIKNGMPVSFPEWDGFKMFKQPFPTYKEKPQFPMFKEKGFHYTEIPYMGDVDLFGYFQSHRYWEHCEGTIRDIFEPSDEIKEKLKEYDIGINDCAIHVRLTDYVRLKDYHTNLPMDYYNKGIELTSADRYFVFSDDIETCKTLFPNNFIFISTGDDMVDFFLMTKFRIFICANSSWSYWVSFLSKHLDKKIIFPRKELWFAEENKHANVDDLYRREWRLI